MQEVRYRLFIAALFYTILPTLGSLSIWGNILSFSVVLTTATYSLISGLVRWKLVRQEELQEKKQATQGWRSTRRMKTHKKVRRRSNR
ncbi:hypothetical protein B9G55_18150 [Saccharibacillus sp. O16]|nr:hypothetical protein B9G55_18150 [Saccharibacillus sp. O16]